MLGLESIFSLEQMMKTRSNLVIPTSFLASRTFTSVAITATACVLALTMVSEGDENANVEAVAAAQQPSDDGEQGRISAAEQRKQIIAELKAVQTRMERLESLIAKGISVRVTEMPPREADRDKPGK